MSVVFPASGWEMIANVRREFTSVARSRSTADDGTVFILSGGTSSDDVAAASPSSASRLRLRLLRRRDERFRGVRIDGRRGG